MNFLRKSTALSSVARRARPLTARQTLRPLSITASQRAHQGYGDGAGNPFSENPQEQGASNATKHNAEHPGPEPPREGQNTGGGPTKGGSSGGRKAPEDASANSGGSRSKEAKETGSSPTGGSVGGKSASSRASNSESPVEGSRESARQAEQKKPAEPKLSSPSEPGEGNSQEKEAEVKQHNKEFEERYDRAAPANKDAVDPKFWKGEGSAEK